MAIYTANHMIRHNGVLFKKGEELKGVPREACEELLKHRAVTKHGSDEVKAAQGPAKNARAKAANGGKTSSPIPSEPGSGAHGGGDASGSSTGS